MNTEEVVGIVERHRDGHGGLIAILQDIQARYNFLPADALRVVAERTDHSLVDVYGVATFYRSFSLEPRGKHLISVCLGTACHVRGGPIIAEEFGRALNVKPGATTADKEFTLETVNCLGACALGPIVVVDGHYYSNVSPVKVKEIVDEAKAGISARQISEDPRVFPVDISCPRCGHTLMDGGYLIDGHPSVKVTAAFENKHGWARLSSLYGSYAVECEHAIPARATVDFFCPHCNAALTGAGPCPVCEATLIPLAVRGSGVVQICSRRGCTYHMLDVLAEVE